MDMIVKPELSLHHSAWLESVRGIPVEIAAEFVVSSGSNLAFEFRRNGECVFRKVRGEKLRGGQISKEFWIEPSGVPLILFNEDCLREQYDPSVPLVICEGEIDAMSWMAAGATAVVSVPNGAPPKRGQGDIIPEDDKGFSYLWKDGGLHPGLAKFRKVILATDGDEKGQILADELAIRIGRSKCWMIKYPDGCKDANEVLLEHGVDELLTILDTAKPLVADRLVPFSHIAERSDRPAYSTGWIGMDPYLRIVPPELMVVTGAPGAGKSQFALAMCANLAWYHNLPGAILQFEDSVERNRRDLRTFARAKLDVGSVENNAEADRWIDSHIVTLSPAEDFDDSVDFDLRWLQGAIEEGATRHGCRWILIDPWNEIEHMWKINESETAYTNKALKDIKRLARKFDLAVIIVAHPSKSGGQIASIDDKSIYDVSGSAAWKNKCDHGIIIHRPIPTDPFVTVKIDKSKDHLRMGKPGIVRMRYSLMTADYKLDV